MTIGPNDPRYSPVMVPPRVDAPKAAPMRAPKAKPVKAGKMKSPQAGSWLDYYLGPTGIPARLAALNSMFNPVETVGQSMRASQQLFDPQVQGWDKVTALGNMLSGVAGVVAPMVAAAKVGAPAANAVVDAFTGMNPNFIADEHGGIKAFHGSPHDFDRFSLDKIGTGEGAQAYGHGLYFAENEGVARGYRDTLARNYDVVKYAGEPIIDGGKNLTTPYGAGSYVDRAKYALATRNGDVEQALDDLHRAAATYGNRNDQIREQAAAQAYAELKRARDAGEIDTFRNPGSMYEVNINADPADFLDWDKPLSEQPQVVRDWFDSRGITPGFAGNQSGAELMQAENSVLGADGAAAAMREAKIPGIKYLDHGSRFNAADGKLQQSITRNYVVFDDKLIDIVRKYGIAGLMMMGGAGMQQEQGGI